MADHSAIEWTDATVNPVRAKHKTALIGEPGWRTRLPGGKAGWHCEHVSEGCRNCYAEGINHRLGTGLPFKPGHLGDVEIFLDEKILTQPLRWKKPRKIFWGSMTDLGGSWVTDAMLDRIFAVMALTPQHTHQFLTKRPERMREYMTAELKGSWAGRVVRIDDDGTARPETDAAWRIRHVVTEMLREVPGEALNRAVAFMDKRDGGDGDGFFRRWPLPNVWLGTSCEDQATADERIPHLLQTPAAVRFVSCEPLLGPIDLTRLRGEATWRDALGGRLHTGPGILTGEPRLGWVIIGGESGPNARPHNISWDRSLIDQCNAAGVPCFEKQLGRRPYWDLLNGCGKWPRGAPTRIELDGRQVDAITLKDKKGGDWSEWPDDLRIRQFPEVQP